MGYLIIEELAPGRRIVSDLKPYLKWKNYDNPIPNGI